MESKIIFLFLDVDGVLNTSSQWKRMYQLDEKCVCRFADFVKTLKGDVRVILTSSWKNGLDPAGKHTPQVKTLIDVLSTHGIPVIGKTITREDEDRAKEINDYISNHHLEQTRCIIVDDDQSLFQSPIAKNCTMIWTDAKNGFVSPNLDFDSGFFKTINRWEKKLFKH